MRDGRKIDTFNIEDHSQEEVVNMMVGRDISQVFPKNKCKRGAQRLSVEHLKDTTGFVKDVSFNLHSGEIVGLSGLVGSGRTESVEMIFGIRKIESGDIFVDGEKVVPKNPRHMINKGISLIPEDRKKQGLALKDKIKWNIGQVVLHEKFPTNVIIEPKVDSLACEYVEKLRIACIDVNSVCQKLSGGNQQKVVLAKWLVCNSNIIIFDEPTRGIDVGAKLEIYQIMCDLANQGKAVLCISSELSEILGMCNRVYVFNEGEVIGEIDKNEKNFSAEGIGEMMLLSKEKQS
jgi:ribose transport system ATP-binding protein